MLRESSHFTDEELLQAADGELSTLRAAEVRSHLAACWGCRTRMADMEETIANFVRAYRVAADSQPPDGAAARARLRVRLGELAAKPRGNSRQRFFLLAPWTRVAAYICAAALITWTGGKRLFPSFMSHITETASFSPEPSVLPDGRLTPGATRLVAISDVCQMPHEEVISAVPIALREEVFREYGIVNPNLGDYEIDYLIAPGLGGREDIRNLWPEPSRSRTWNAHVKDALEEQLHQLVCSGKLDLHTAQRDIAGDWIAAYKKYFHSDKPMLLIVDPALPLRSSLTSPD